MAAYDENDENDVEVATPRPPWEGSPDGGTAEQEAAEQCLDLTNPTAAYNDFDIMLGHIARFSPPLSFSFLFRISNALLRSVPPCTRHVAGFTWRHAHRMLIVLWLCCDCGMLYLGNHGHYMLIWAWNPAL